MVKGIIASLCLAFAAAGLFAQQAQEESRKSQENQETKEAASDAKREEHSSETPKGTDAADSLPSAPGVDPKSYVIGPEDVLNVRVWREPELSTQAMVRPDGRISLPLINDIPAAGLTPVQLAGTITEGLSKFLNQPEVSVAVQAVNSKNYFLQGEVLKPGRYPLLIPTTVLQALVNAGGFQEFANRKKIVIMRGNERFTFNYNDVIKGKKLEQNILLENGDLIIVP